MTLKPLTLDDVKSVLGRALVDPEFLDKLSADPEGVLSILGFEASANSIAFFKNLKGSTFENAGADIVGSLSKKGALGWF